MLGTSLAVQWLRLHTATAGGTGSIPDWGTKILHAIPHGAADNNNNNNLLEGYLGGTFLSYLTDQKCLKNTHNTHTHTHTHTLTLSLTSAPVKKQK